MASSKIDLRSFTTICFAIFVTMLGMGIISPLLTVYASGLGATGIQIGFMVAGYSLSRAFVQTFTGWFSDRRGRKSLMVIGLAAYTVISLGYSIALNIYHLTAVRFLHGLASALVIPVAQAYVGDLCPKGKEDIYMGLFQGSYAVGIAAGPILGGSIWDATGSMNPAFYTMAALAACGLIFMILFVPQTPVHMRNRKGSAPMSVVLKDRKVWAVAIYLGSRGILRQGITAFVVLFATRVLGMSITMGSLTATIFIMTEAFTQGMVGTITSRFPRKPVMVFAAIVGSILAFFVGHATSFSSLIVILMPLALMTAAGRVPALAFNVEIGAKYRRMGVGMGIANAAQDLGHFIGPIAFGEAMDRFGISSVFAIGGIICLATVPFMTYLLYQKDTVYVPPTE